MKKLLLLTVLSFAVHATFAKEDSLIARIGNKAKVTFYAERPEDLKEIEKYDLNLLFRQLKRRAEKNFTFSEDVTLKDADELKNREANRVVSPQSWFRGMNLNLFVGATKASVDKYRSAYSNIEWAAHFLGNPYQGKFGNSVVVRDLYDIASEQSIMFGIGGYFDKTLLQKRKTSISLKYGAGFDFINTKMALKKGRWIPFPEDSIYINSSGTMPPDLIRRSILSTNVYAELQPTFNFFNSKGEKTFRFGVGVKVASSLNSFNKSTFSKNYLYEQNGPYVTLKYKALQTALTATVGYKYVNMFYQVTPNNIVVNGAVQPEYFPFNTPRQINATSYVIGLRFGK
ncbi:hypothetical protein [Emticicia sp. TH156]|uniref:hypothetical protein n=1 Tax=Emticicia sp. TH156 TaxID=2067454 RepID=UPI000C760BA3|nr:hypothetical protein [Emticicia sp. TH156]PLK43142.1 hypothetical protein C0V77_17345 [Emticicia sp. TH156]